MTLGIVLLYGPRKWVFLMSKVPLYQIGGKVDPVHEKEMVQRRTPSHSPPSPREARG